MSSRPPSRRVWGWLGIATSTVILLLLLARLDVQAARELMMRVDPMLAGATVLVSGLTISARGLRVRSLARAHAPATIHSLAWARVAAVHQVVFSVLPSGFGDLAFPVIARRTVGLGLGRAGGMVAVYRLQDLLALGTMLASGWIWFHATHLGPAAGPLGAAILAAGVASLAHAGPLARFLARTGARAVRHLPGRAGALAARGYAAFDDAPHTSTTARVETAALAVLSWASAGLAIWLAFASFGYTLSLGAVMIVLSGLNLIGLLAVFTVAGLGVAEGGLAALIIALGFPPAQALAAALLIRPLLLASIMASCGLIELAWRIYVRASPGPASDWRPARNAD